MFEEYGDSDSLYLCFCGFRNSAANNVQGPLSSIHYLPENHLGMSRLTARIRAWKARCRDDDGQLPELDSPVAAADSEPPLAATPDPVTETPACDTLPMPRLPRPHTDWTEFKNAAAPEYPELATVSLPVLQNRPRPVFITARFRSGSTLLWNLFRHTPGITAYYEPLHPTLQQPPEQRVPALDPTHDDVTDYWSEYGPIEGLASWYTQPWHCRDLYLDELDWQPGLAEYIRVLLHSAAGRPVLQFNRVDFRLAWLRRTFPAARLVHLFRHPRDQWLSSLRRAPFGPHDSKERFAEHDYFFLGEWVADLSAQFPVLDWERVEHPYEMFYLLWKLSYLWGKAYSDMSIAYERLLAARHRTIAELYELLELDRCHVAQVAELVHDKGTGKWRAYADAAWFTARERAAESQLDTFLGQLPPAPHITLRAAG